MRVAWVRLAASIALVLLSAAAFGDDLAGPVTFVPWKVLMPGDAPPKSPLTLFWIPASADDFKHSDMLFSRSLTAYSAQCVAMDVVRADDTAMIEKLGASGALPAAVLVDADGRQLGKVANERGVLRVSDVERVVRDQVRAREAEVDAELDAARRKVMTDRDAAVVTFKSIWDLRCLCPRQARAAERELKRLGVELADAH